MRDLAGPMAPGLARIYQQQAQENSAAAQQQMQQYLGPEAQGKNPLVRFGHGLASYGYSALGVGDKMLGGVFGMNPGQSLMTAIGAAAPPAAPLAAAVMGTTAAPGFWDSAKTAYAHPTPDNVENALLGGSMLAGAAAGAGMRTAPVGEIRVAPRGAPAPDVVHVSPQMYLAKIGAHDPASILKTPEDIATVNHFRDQIRAGASIDPATITHDETTA